MRAIVFDLDGTLLESTREYRAVLADAVRAVAGEVRETWLETYEETVDELLADCTPDAARRAFARTGCEADPEAFAETLLDREMARLTPSAGVHRDLAASPASTPWAC